MVRDFAVGIDLHGTLLNDNWLIPERLTPILMAALRSVSEFCELFLCTGNDLSFLHERLEQDVLSLFDGFVLETGCVSSDGQSEEILVPSEPLSMLRELERSLRDESLPSIEYFARRLATISLFTKTELGGPDPIHLYPIVIDTIEKMGFAADVLVTHSDVAVDIIPAGFNKYTGLRHIAEAASIIGIADSLNDVHLITDAERAFVPANASPVLLSELEDRGLDVVPLGGSTQHPGGAIEQSEFSNTEAVIDILHYLRDHLS